MCRACLDGIIAGHDQQQVVERGGALVRGPQVHLPHVMHELLTEFVEAGSHQSKGNYCSLIVAMSD